MVQSTRLFPRSMGRWLMALLLVMLSSLVTRADEAYAYYVSENTTLFFCYDNLRAFRTDPTYDLNSGGVPEWFLTTFSSVTKVVFLSSFSDVRPTSTSYWFYLMKNLTSITGISNLNTSEVTSMDHMFDNCSNLTNLDVSNFNTAKVTSMDHMFYNCSNLTSLDVSNFNTAKVTDMCAMFYNCKQLTSLNVSNFNTAKVTDMGAMFEKCSGLTSLDLSSFNTSSATAMGGMFRQCSGLTSLNLSSFNTAKVTTMEGMFDNCSSLTSLNLSSFNTSSVTNMYGMFKDSPSLETIYVGSGWSTAAVTISDNMFENCFGLMGGKGTIYDDDHMDATYAHIDGGTSNPGYLTDYSPPCLRLLHTVEHDADVLLRQPARQSPGHDL